jgi:hypothetical protein
MLAVAAMIPHDAGSDITDASEIMRVPVQDYKNDNWKMSRQKV